MKTLKSTLLSLLLLFVAFNVHAQEISDSDLMTMEMYTSDFPTDEGIISLEEGISGDYQLLNYNILGNLDENEGRDAAVILVHQGEEGTDYYLYAVLSDQSFPNPVAYAFLGRDIALLNLAIVEGQIIVDFVAEGEEETYLTSRKIFELNGESLALVFDGDLDEGHPFSADDALSYEELSNITYPLDWFDYPVALVDGIAVNLIGNTEQSSQFTYNLREENIAYGDLNGDGLEDALVYLAAQIEGYEGENWLIAAVLNYHGYPQFADAEVDRMGSPSRLEALSIDEDGLINFDYTDLSHQALVVNHFVLEEGQLVRQ